jgi:hypothetical protein
MGTKPTIAGETHTVTPPPVDENDNNADKTPRLHAVNTQPEHTPTKAPKTTAPKTTQLATQWAAYATPPSPQGGSPYDSRINIPIDTHTAQHLNTISHALATTRHKYPLNRSQLITECAQAVIDDIDGHWNRYMTQRDKVMTSTITALQGRIPTDLHEQIRALGYTETGKRPMGALIALAIKERIGL